MEQKLVLRPLNPPLKQIHDVMTIDLPADQKTGSQQLIISVRQRHSAAHYCESQWLLKPSDQSLWITFTPLFISSDPAAH